VLVLPILLVVLGLVILVFVNPEAAKFTSFLSRELLTLSKLLVRRGELLGGIFSRRTKDVVILRHELRGGSAG